MPEPTATVVHSTAACRVLQAQLGEWDNLNHLIVCTASKEAVVVDPFDAAFWFETAAAHGFRLVGAWLTHSHWDHTKGIEEALALGGEGFEVVVHEAERERGWSGPHTRALDTPPNVATALHVGELTFEAIRTPGHTPGHLTFLGHGIVVSGDCLFLGRCGRADLHGGDPASLRSSLKHLRSRMQALPEEWIVLPGHAYTLPDGRTPYHLTLGEVLNENEAMAALDSDEAWTALPFLAFDDALARRARDQS
ncbi:MAG: hypothetical protein CMA08_02080 [Euryarchaeota archaeon]|nr:hypothetical protein [Euryarchaeota archaeon]OUX22683.1 MAG: hypothetical protein CBE12_01555 [Euryarchaeota archaeon TMED252]